MEMKFIDYKNFRDIYSNPHLEKYTPTYRRNPHQDSRICSIPTYEEPFENLQIGGVHTMHIVKER